MQLCYDNMYSITSLIKALILGGILCQINEVVGNVIAGWESYDSQIM